MSLLAKYVRFKQRVIHIDAKEAADIGNYSRVRYLYTQREHLMEKVNKVIDERIKAAAKTSSGPQPQESNSTVDASSQKKRKSLLAESK